MKPGLSISWGVRFYHDLPQYDKRGFISSFSPAAWDPRQAPALTAGRGQRHERGHRPAQRNDL